MYAAMVVGDTSLVKPRLPTNRRPLRDRPTPAVNIRVHLDTYDWLKKLKKPDESFDHLIRLLLGRAVIVKEDPSGPGS